MRITNNPVAVARERTGITVPDLAVAIGINEPSCWDLLDDKQELSICLNLRQFLRLASVLRVQPLSLLQVPQTSSRAHRTIPELAEKIRGFCATRGFSIGQFNELAGWDVQPFLDAPNSALDCWCLDTLRDVCEALDFYWPDFIPDAINVAR